MAVYRGTYYSSLGCTGTKPGVQAATSWYLGAYRSRNAANLGTYVCKGLGSGWSIHADGRAADWGTSPYGVPSSWGWELANALRLHSNELGIQLIIFQNRLWSCTQPDAGWRSYSGDYHGHLHVEFTPHAARTLSAARVQQVVGGGGPGDSAAAPSGMPPLRHGASGVEARRLQAALNKAIGARLAEDGEYGPATVAAVKTLQQRSRITADGVYGPATAVKLTGLLEDDMQLNDTVDMYDEKGKKRWWSGNIIGKDKITVNSALQYAAASLYYTRNEVMPELRASRKRDEAILAAMKGLDTQAILTRIDQRAAEDAARDQAVLELLDQHASGSLDAEAVVQRIGQLLAAGRPDGS